MEKSLKCPYCNQMFQLMDCSCYAESTLNKFYFDINFCEKFDSRFTSDYYKLSLAKCPNCGQQTIQIEEMGSKGSVNKTYQVKPVAIYNTYPEYVPEGIRQDYVEAYSILHASPKASATLARRCLQGMIRDFWNIKKNTLNDEIKGLKSLIPAEQWKAIDALRSIGNIGAHMEKDVNTIIDVSELEAEKLIKMIELLIKQWYVDRHEQQELYSDLHIIDEQKKEQKKSAKQVGAN